MAGKIEITDNQGLRSFVSDREPGYIKLMRAGPDEPLARAADMNCYHMSLVIAYQLFADSRGYRDIFTMDGRGRCLTRAGGHALLGILLSDGYSYVDGTVWQLFPEEAHMKIGGPYPSIGDMGMSLVGEYGGVWKSKKIPQQFLTSSGYRQDCYLMTSKRDQRRRANGTR